MSSDACPFAPVFGVIDTALGNTTASREWVFRFVHASKGAAVANTSVAAVLLVVSVLLVFAGSRLVRPTFFVMGFAVVAIAGYAAIAAILDTTDASAGSRCWTLALAPLACGLAGGTGALAIAKIAFAATGLAAGLSVGYLLYTVGLSRLDSVAGAPEPGGRGVAFWITLGVCGALGACLLVQHEHEVLAIATALVGAAGLIPALDL